MDGYALALASSLSPASFAPVAALRVPLMRSKKEPPALSLEPAEEEDEDEDEDEADALPAALLVLL
jgi:hypothetical protein